MLDIFEEFAVKMVETNSRLDKEDILKQYSDYEEVRYVLNFIYNPYITTGISAKKIKKAEKMSGETDAQMSTYRDLLLYFSTHNTGTDVDLLVLSGWLKYFPDKAGLIKEIVAKSLKLGVQPKTINKIFGDNFIPEFSVQLAEKYFDDPEKYLPKGKKFIL